MDTWWMAGALGMASGALTFRAARWPVLAWVASLPLGIAVALLSPAEAALAGLVAGGLGSAASVSTPAFRALLPITVAPSAGALALTSALAAWITGRVGSLALIATLPLAVVLSLVPLRLLGAPRWVSSPLACTQEGSLPMVHTARLGGDLTLTALLAMASALAALGVVRGWPWAVACVIFALGVRGLGALSLRRAAIRVAGQPRVRVAAVVVDPPWDPTVGFSPIDTPAHRDVERTLSRYAAPVARAAGAGAEILVLPEVSAHLDEEAQPRFIEAITGWAAALDVTIVAPWLDAAAPANTLAVIDRTGVRATYDKQHPARGLEPVRRARQPPGRAVVHTRSGDVALSAVICVDLDYTDLLRPVHRDGGILVAPANDFFGGFELRHDRTAVWAAVITGVTTLRATGHGISSARDGAGVLLGSASSEHGEVVLVVDAPIAPPARLSASARGPSRDPRG